MQLAGLEPGAMLPKPESSYWRRKPRRSRRNKWRKPKSEKSMVSRKLRNSKLLLLLATPNSRLSPRPQKASRNREAELFQWRKLKLLLKFSRWRRSHLIRKQLSRFSHSPRSSQSCQTVLEKLSPPRCKRPPPWSNRCGKAPVPPPSESTSAEPNSPPLTLLQHQNPSKSDVYNITFFSS